MRRSLAGLRVGYVVGDPDLVAALAALGLALIANLAL